MMPRNRRTYCRARRYRLLSCLLALHLSLSAQQAQVSTVSNLPLTVDIVGPLREVVKDLPISALFTVKDSNGRPFENAIVTITFDPGVQFADDGNNRDPMNLKPLKEGGSTIEVKSDASGQVRVSNICPSGDIKLNDGIHISANLTYRDQNNTVYKAPPVSLTKIIPQPRFDKVSGHQVTNAEAIRPGNHGYLFFKTTTEDDETPVPCARVTLKVTPSASGANGTFEKDALITNEVTNKQTIVRGVLTPNDVLGGYEVIAVADMPYTVGKKAIEEGEPVRVPVTNEPKTGPTPPSPAAVTTADLWDLTFDRRTPPRVAMTPPPPPPPKKKMPTWEKALIVVAVVAAAGGVAGAILSRGNSSGNQSSGTSSTQPPGVILQPGTGTFGH